MTHIAATAPPPLYADRTRVYPHAMRGRVRQVKWAVLIVCLGIYYLLPWLRWDRGAGRPHQAVLLDLAEERFYFFNLQFWPQDIYYLTGLMILGAIGLFLVTSLAWRVWCGFACPQTVWTDLFMWVERQVEGDRNARMRRDRQKVSLDTIWRKAAKHAIWLAIAFWTGGAWVMYYVDAPIAVRQFWTGTGSSQLYWFTALFTAVTYVLAGWAREQVCTYMCPWPRFQAAMMDQESLVVTYQDWRGEPRGHLKAATAGRHGDCIDCNLCVIVCPTGVDIRQGVQLECIGCGLCVDACNHTMAQIGRAPWLITWDTLARQSAKAAAAADPAAAPPPPIRLLRPRTLIYVGALLLGIGGMSVALARRPNIAMTALHDRAPLFVRIADGTVRNAYTLKIDNKLAQPVHFELSLDGLANGRMALGESHAAQARSLTLLVGANAVGAFRLLVFAPDSAAAQLITFSLRDPFTGETTRAQASFLGSGSIVGAVR